ncbi:hypothetical protein BMS3Bbin06_01504 [bacterium BMS3Bbin06]|nr:hypothetical protein BMS3Bbin06_01504 [bacterium BMS3Bbin06]
MKRRTFLKGIGGITVLMVGGGVWRAYDQGVFSIGQGPAYEPWKNWRTDANEGPLALVRAAILAASPHNTQPWIFKVMETRIELYADTSRNLGTLDPYLRRTLPWCPGKHGSCRRCKWLQSEYHSVRWQVRSDSGQHRTHTRGPN